MVLTKEIIRKILRTAGWIDIIEITDLFIDMMRRIRPGGIHLSMCINTIHSSIKQSLQIISLNLYYLQEKNEEFKKANSDYERWVRLQMNYWTSAWSQGLWPQYSTSDQA